jgi:RNA polymerase sigma-70 factor (ECF subfamily)
VRASRHTSGLVERAARHDQAALSELYRAYVDRVYGFAYRQSGSADVAEDVTAATFHAAKEGLPRFASKGSDFGPWLFELAAEQLAARVPEARARSERGRVMLAQLATRGDRAVGGGSAAAVTTMLRAMGTLPPRHRDALQLRYLSGLTPDEAAEIMDCSRTALGVTVHRALGGLRRAMAREP